MGAEDYPAFVNAPYIPSVYFRIGGTSDATFAAADKGGPAIAANHSPLFRIEPDLTIRTGVETSVLALLDLLGKN
jgi:hippurate hydrolase